MINIRKLYIYRATQLKFKHALLKFENINLKKGVIYIN
jgi:hypothetical protein